MHQLAKWECSACCEWHGCFESYEFCVFWEKCGSCLWQSLVLSSHYFGHCLCWLSLSSCLRSTLCSRCRRIYQVHKQIRMSSGSCSGIISTIWVHPCMFCSWQVRVGRTGRKCALDKIAVIDYADATSGGWLIINEYKWYDADDSLLNMVVVESHDSYRDSFYWQERCFWWWRQQWCQQWCQQSQWQQFRARAEQGRSLGLQFPP